MNSVRPLYWLTPIVKDNPLTLGRERISLPSSEELADFRARLGALHPRLLPLFKSHLLPGEEEEFACGTEEPLPFDLSGGGDIAFDGERLSLSHCAQAFLSRLLPAAETQMLLFGAERKGKWSIPQSSWLAFFQDWSRRGYSVIIVKEE